MKRNRLPAGKQGEQHNANSSISGEVNKPFVRTLTAVKELTAKGFVIHPLSKPDDKGSSPGKKPLLTGWQTLTQTPDDIGAYIKDGCNIGLVCGKASGVMVLDFDHELFKDDIFHGMELNTLISGRTNGRGHIYFKFHQMLISQKHHELGIEVLSNGSNAVLPPSIHKSGDVYKWANPDAPIMDMPEEVLKRLNILFRTETELKQIIAKCRHCFRDIIKRKPDMHGAEGREYMIAVCTDMKANDATEDHIKIFAKLMYGKGYDEARTLQEWRNIDPAKTWKCDTLKAKLPAYIDLNECDKCDKRRERNTGNDKGSPENDKKQCGDCQHYPGETGHCYAAKRFMLDDFDAGTCKQFKQAKEKKETSTKKEYKTNGAFDYIDRIIEKTPIYYDNTGQFGLWCKEGYYKQVDNTEILLTLLIDIADPSIIQKNFKGELLEAARLRGRDAKVKPVPNNWIHIQNGVYDIKTGDLFEATPEYLFTEPIPHKLSVSEDTPTIDRLFSEWVTPEKVPLLNEIAAYCLYNGYPIHRMFVLLGRGRNGKGQFRDLIVNLVGHHNRSASTLEQLINSRFETARLYNKKICTMGEINYALLDRTAILKMLSGGDPIPGEQKNKTPFEFVNTAKLLINTNSLPQTSDKTDAFYSRCIVVEFGQQFQLGKDIIETIPQTEYDNFLTKCLRILRELLERGQFTNEGNIQEKEREYERLSNPLTQFIQMYYEPDINGKVAAWRLWNEYEIYCGEKGIRKPQSKKHFNDMLKINYDVDTKNLLDDETKKQNNWVWVFGIKKRDLHDLHVLHDIPLKAPIGELSDSLCNSCKSYNTDNSRHDKNLPFDTKIVPSKTCKSITELSQLDKMVAAKNLILNHYGYQPLSPEGIDFEADNLKVQLSISKDEAMEYVKRAIADRDRGA